MCPKGSRTGPSGVDPDLSAECSSRESVLETALHGNYPLNGIFSKLGGKQRKSISFPPMLVPNNISLLCPDQREGREKPLSGVGSWGAEVKVKSLGICPLQEDQAQYFIPRGFSKHEWFNLLLPREQRREILPNASCRCRCCHISGARCPLWQPGRERSPAAVEQQPWPPYQTLHLSLLSGAQGLQEHWGAEGAEGSSIMYDQHAWRAGREERTGGRRRREAALSKSRHEHGYKSACTNVGGKKERKEW